LLESPLQGNVRDPWTTWAISLNSIEVERPRGFELSSMLVLLFNTNDGPELVPQVVSIIVMAFDVSWD
jgi:hypothetical protein